jgi:MFS family permease
MANRRRSLRSHLRDALGSFRGTFVTSDDGMAPGRRIVLSSTTISDLLVTILGGVYLTGMLLAVGADDIYINYVTMAGFLCGFVQIAAPLLWERTARRKALLLVLRGAYHLLDVVVLGVIVLLPMEKTLRLVLLMTVIVLRNLINSFSTPGLSIWKMQSVPQQRRNDYFTVYNILTHVIGVTSAYLAGRLLDAFEENGWMLYGIAPTLSAILLLRMLGLLLAVAELALLSRLEEYPYELPKPEEERGVHLLLVPLLDTRYMRTVSIDMVWQFITYLIGSFFTVYLLDVVHMSYSYIMLCSFVNVPLILVMTPVWSRLVKRCRWQRMLPIAIGGYAIPYVFNALIVEDTQYFYAIVMILVYLFYPCISLVLAYLPYENMPDTCRTAYMSVYSIGTMLSGLVGTFVGTLFMQFTKGIVIPIFGVPMLNYQYLNLIQALLLLALSGYIVFTARRVAPLK